MSDSTNIAEMKITVQCPITDRVLRLERDAHISNDVLPTRVKTLQRYALTRRRHFTAISEYSPFLLRKVYSTSFAFMSKTKVPRCGCASTRPCRFNSSRTSQTGRLTDAQVVGQGDFRQRLTQLEDALNDASRFRRRPYPSVRARVPKSPCLFSPITHRLRRVKKSV